MKYLFAILSLLSITLVKGQNETLSVKKIDSIIKSIDTTSIFESSIADGIIERKNEKKISGGFSDDYKIIDDSTKKRLLKVNRIESLNYSDYSTYYFYHDSLVYATIERRSRKENKKKVIASGKYYFQNNTLIRKEEKGTPIKKPDAFLQQARFFIKNLDSQ